MGGKMWRIFNYNQCQKKKKKKKGGRRFKDGNIAGGIYSKSAPEQCVWNLSKINNKEDATTT